MFQIVGELVLEFVAPDRRSTSAISEWVTRLYHELGYHTMEENAFVISAARMAHEVLNRLRGLLREEAEMNVTQVGVYSRCICNRGRSRFRCGCSRSDRLLFSCGPFVEGITISGFIVSANNPKLSVYGRDNKKCERNSLRLRLRKHIEPLTLIARTE